MNRRSFLKRLAKLMGHNPFDTIPAAGEPARGESNASQGDRLAR